MLPLPPRTAARRAPAPRQIKTTTSSISAVDGDPIRSINHAREKGEFYAKSSKHGGRLIDGGRLETDVECTSFAARETDCREGSGFEERRSFSAAVEEEGNWVGRERHFNLLSGAGCGAAGDSRRVTLKSRKSAN